MNDLKQMIYDLCSSHQGDSGLVIDYSEDTTEMPITINQYTDESILDYVHRVEQRVKQIVSDYCELHIHSLCPMDRRVLYVNHDNALIYQPRRLLNNMSDKLLVRIGHIEQQSYNIERSILSLCE